MITETAILERDRALSRVQQHESFNSRAENHILAALMVCGELSGESLVDSCLEAGIVPVANETRAFGPVLMRLARKGQIVKCGYVARNKGHGTAGGNLWRLA
jgi:hypothetical protein